MRKEIIIKKLIYINNISNYLFDYLYILILEYIGYEKMAMFYIKHYDPFFYINLRLKDISKSNSKIFLVNQNYFVNYMLSNTYNYRFLYKDMIKEHKIDEIFNNIYVSYQITLKKTKIFIDIFNRIIEWCEFI